MNPLPQRPAALVSQQYGFLRICGRRNLFVRQSTHEPRGANIFICSSKYLLALLDRLFLCIGDMVGEPDNKVTAQVPSPCHTCLHPLPSMYHPFPPHRPPAAPPPIMPLMPCFAIRFSPRSLALTIGCQHSTGRLSGRGTKVTSSNS